MLLVSSPGGRLGFYSRNNHGSVLFRGSASDGDHQRFGPCPEKKTWRRFSMVLSDSLESAVVVIGNRHSLKCVGTFRYQLSLSIDPAFNFRKNRVLIRFFELWGLAS
jgi:hypothetical protein